MLDALLLEFLEALALTALLLLLLSALFCLDLGSELKPPLVALNRAGAVVCFPSGEELYHDVGKAILEPRVGRVFPRLPARARFM